MQLVDWEDTFSVMVYVEVNQEFTNTIPFARFCFVVICVAVFFVVGARVVGAPNLLSARVESCSTSSVGESR